MFVFAVGLTTYTQRVLHHLFWVGFAAKNKEISAALCREEKWPTLSPV
jgi:hypothetical protein